MSEQSNVYVRVTFFLLTVFLASGWTASTAANGSGQTTAEILKFGSDARIPALGGAGVATSRGAASLDYNPAGLGNMNRDFEPGVSFLPVSTGGARLMNWGRDFQAGYHTLPEGVNFFGTNYAGSISDHGSRPRLLEGSWAVGLQHLGYGRQPRIERESGILTRQGTFTSSSLVASLGYGQNWANWSFGFAGRYVRQELAEVTGQSHSLDLGVRWNSRFRPITAGLVLANLGPGVSFDSRRESLPEQLQLGISRRFYRLGVESGLEVEYRFNSEQLNYSGGLEWWLLDQLALRVGYQAARDVDNGLSAGLGYWRSQGDVKFDYAYLPYGEFGSVHQLGFQLRLD